MEKFMYSVGRAMDFIAHAANAIDNNTEEYLSEAKDWYDDTLSKEVIVARYIMDELSQNN